MQKLGEVMLDDKLFVIEHNRNSLTWKPFDEFKKGVKHKSWAKLNGIVKKTFKGVKLKQTPLHYKCHSIGDKNAKFQENSNTELNKQTIETFWNKLKSNPAISAMYFTVGKQEFETSKHDGEHNVNLKEYYLIVKFENEIFKWSPSSMEDADWDDEYEILKTDICKHFLLDNSNDTMRMEIKIVDDANDANDDDDEDEKCETIEVEDGADIESAWIDMIENKTQKHIVCKVTGVKKSKQAAVGNDDVKDYLKDKLMDFGSRISETSINDCNNKVLTYNMDSPNNAEKELTFLFENVLFRKKHMINDKRNEIIVKPMIEIVKKLLKSLKQQGFSQTSMIIGNIDECEKHIENMDWRGAFKCLKEAMNRLRPFNINEMLNLFDKTENAAKQIKGKDVVLILGHTGAGKSTTIHFLAGSQMVQDQRTRHIYPKRITNASLENVKTEYKVTESVTRYIAGVPISLSQAGVKIRGRDAKDNIVLCDTPGFDDSSGAEVDVANGLGIIRAITQAKSVKIVLIISRGDLEQRMEGLKQLCYTLAHVLVNFMGQVVNIGIVMTKIGGENVNEYLQHTFEAALDEMQEKKEDDDDVVVEMFSHIVELCENNKLISLNPLKDDRKRVLKTLFEDKAGWIKYPKEEFQSFVTQSSRSRIIEQIDKIKDVIVKSPNNYELALNKLTLLTKLDKVLGIKGVIDHINDCVFNVRKFWNQQCKTAMKELQRGIAQGSLDAFENDIIQFKQVLMGVMNYKQLYTDHLEVKEKEKEKDKSIIISRQDESGDDVKQFENKTAKLQRNVAKEAEKQAEVIVISPKMMQELLFSQFNLVLVGCRLDFVAKNGNGEETKDGNDGETKSIDNIMIDNCLGKAQSIMNCFGEQFEQIVPEYKKQMHELMNNANKLAKNGITAINDGKFEECLSILVAFGNVYDMHHRCGDPGHVVSAMTSLQDYLVDHLQNTYQNLREMFDLANTSNNNINNDNGTPKTFRSQYDVPKNLEPKSEEEMEQAKVYFNKIKEIKKCCNDFKLTLHPKSYILLKMCDEYYESILKHVFYHSNALSNHINQILRQNQKNEAYEKQTMQKIKLYIEYFGNIQQIDQDIEIKIGSCYHQALQKIIGYLQNIEMRFECIIKAMDTNSDLIDYQQLVRCVVVLKESKWVYRYYDKQNDEDTNLILSNVESRLENFLMDIDNVAQITTIAVEKVQSLNTINAVINHLIEMRSLEMLFPQLTKRSEKIMKAIESEVKRELKRIRSSFKIKRKDDVKDEDEKDDYAIGGLDEKDNDEKITPAAIWEVLFTLDKRFAQQSLSFVNECSNMKWFHKMRKKKQKDNEKEQEQDKENQKHKKKKKKTVSMKEIVRETNEHLCDYFRSYGKFKHNQMQLWLDTLMNKNIKGIQGGENTKRNDSPSDMAYALSISLSEFVQLDDKYQEIMSLICDGAKEENLLNQWKNRLMQSHRELEQRLLRLKNAHSVALQDEVFRAKLLSKTDPFLTEGKFNRLYIEYEKSLHSDAGYTKILDCIKLDEPDFGEIGKELNRMKQILELSNENNKVVLESLYTHAQTVVSRKIIELFRDTKAKAIRLRSNISNDQLLDDIRLSRKRQKDSKSHCREHLTENDKKIVETLERDENELLTQCQEKTRNLVMTLIKLKHFGEAEEKIESIGTMSLLLEMEVDIQEIEQLVTNELQSIETTFKTMQLAGQTCSPYNSIPPSTLYLELSQVLSKRTVYQAIWTEIENDIVKKFRHELEIARDANYSEKKRIIHVCQSVLNTLPDKIKHSLLAELQYCKSDIEENEKAEDDKIEKFEKHKDRSQMACYYFSKLKENHNSQANKVKNIVLHEVTMISNKIKQGLQSLNWNDVVDGVTSMKEMLNAFDKQQNLTEFENVSQIKDDTLKRKLEKSSKDMAETITLHCHKLVSEDPPTHKDHVCKYEEQVEFVVNLIEQIDTDRNPLLASTVELHKVLELLVEKMDKFSDEQYSKFEESLKKTKLEDIGNVLKVMHLYQVKEKMYLQNLDKLSTKHFKKELHFKTNTLGKLMDKMDEKIDQIKNEMKKELINNETKKSDASRKNYFDKILQIRLRELKVYHVKQDLIGNDAIGRTIDDAYGECQDYYDSQIDSLSDECVSLMDGTTFFDKKILERINLITCCLTQFEDTVLQHFEATRINKNKSKIQQCIFKLQQKFTTMAVDTKNTVIGSAPKESEFIQNIQKQKQRQKQANVKDRTGEDRTKLAKCLIKLVKGAKYLQLLQDELNNTINDLLEAYATQDPMQIGPLSVILEKTDAIWGSVLVAENEMFRGQLIWRFNKNAQSQNVNHVLDGIVTKTCTRYVPSPLASKAYDQKHIESYFKEFFVHYDQLIEKHLVQPIQLESVITTLTTSVAAKVRRKIERSFTVDEHTNTCQVVNAKYWKDSDIKHGIVHIMAMIFSIWTLDNAKYYFEAPKNLSEDKKKMYLLKPKAAQVIALFRLLSIDCGDTLAPHFVEIGTGEGKSLTLAVASCVLALIGFTVNCVCYSKYLSRRDYESFKKLFEKLNVCDNIKYDTLSNLCDDQISSDIDIRQETAAMLLNERNWNPYGYKENKQKIKKNVVKPSVLLFDEVDILFGDSFFGQTYGAVTSIRSDIISKLTDYIWKHRLHVSLATVKGNQIYIDLIRLFGNSDIRKRFIDLVINQMIEDVHNFTDEDYIVQNDKICYRSFDSYESNICSGHRTLFCAYHEHERGNINNLNYYKQLSVLCCRFSYVELVNGFTVLLGVTGTLSDVINSLSQKKAIESVFKIEKYTFMPTLYTSDHKRKRPKDESQCDIKLCNDKDFHQMLVDEITFRLTHNQNNLPRCVFVFFKDRKELKRFDESHEFAICQNNRILLTEDLDNDAKKLAVTKACISESILLSTKTFGRGTDFQVNDEIVAYNGGPHVIQTFFSDDKSEETQIKGRTARQGGQGSYSIVLKKSQVLEQFDNIQEIDINRFVVQQYNGVRVSTHINNSQLYRLLDGKRKEKFEYRFGELVANAKNPPQSHQFSVCLMNGLKWNSERIAMENLINLCRMDY